MERNAVAEKKQRLENESENRVRYPEQKCWICGAAKLQAGKISTVGLVKQLERIKKISAESVQQKTEHLEMYVQLGGQSFKL